MPLNPALADPYGGTVMQAAVAAGEKPRTLGGAKKSPKKKVARRKKR